MDKRYLAALLLTVLILIGYPHYLRWLGVTPQAEQKSPAPIEQPVPEPEPELEKKAPPAASAETFPYENKLFKLLFTNRGGNILFLKQDDALLYEAPPQGEGIFGITIQHDGEDLNQTVFQSLPPSQAGAVREFSHEKPGHFRLNKRFFAGSEKPTLVLEADIENLSERERNFSIEFHYGLELGLRDQAEEAMAKMVLFAGGEFQQTDLKKIQKHAFPSAGSFEWQGLLRKYYALLIKPESKIVSQETRFEEGHLMSDLRLPQIAVRAGEKKTVRFLIYAGPQSYQALKGFGFGFEKIMTHGILGALHTAILVCLNFFYQLTKNYGAAILLITLVIKLLFTPLTHLSYESMRKMQALQPKLKALQKQHQKDPARLNKEMMELYRRNRVNPMMGCLPLVLQIPIFISFYQVLAGAVELKGADFVWWMHDLSEPDRLFTWPMELPFIGNSFNLLPILMIGSMLWQQKLTPQTAATPGQEKIMYLMPIIFGFVFYNLPSGLVLYWFFNNLLTIFHQLFIKRIPVILHHEDQHHEH